MNKKAFIGFMAGLFWLFIIGLIHGIYFAIKYFRH
jgi:hypothetical protein